LLSIVTAVLYPLASDAVEVSNQVAAASPHPISPATKKVIAKLAALFSLDVLGDGFLTDALVAYWFFRRFGIAEESLGILFFAVHLLNAASHLGATWLARRIGLVNTLVFTHLPSTSQQWYCRTSEHLRAPLPIWRVMFSGRRFHGCGLSYAERFPFRSIGNRG
jgi:hypothetical protein